MKRKKWRRDYLSNGKK